MRPLPLTDGTRLRPFRTHGGGGRGAWPCRTGYRRAGPLWTVGPGKDKQYGEERRGGAGGKRGQEAEPRRAGLSLCRRRDHAGAQPWWRDRQRKGAEHHRLLGVQLRHGAALGAACQVVLDLDPLLGAQFTPARQQREHALVIVHRSTPYSRRNRSRARERRCRMAVPRTPSIWPISSVLNPATSNR